MNIEIAGNRNELWQWDLNQRLLLTDVEPEKHVHFEHGSDALVVLAHEESGLVYADIPNICLQGHGLLHVYIYCPVDTCTRFDKTFHIRERQRPENYVYTETEVLTWKTLDERIAKLEESGGGYYAPSVDDDGNLTWTPSDPGMSEVDGANIAGKPGKSAYQYAVDGGYTGTEAEFAAKLAAEVPEQVQADWNQHDSTAADYVKNRPFYDSRELIASFSAAEVAKNPLEVVQVEGMDFFLMASNKVYTKEEIQKFRFEVNTMETGVEWHQDYTCCVIHNFWIITLQDNIDLDGLIFPTAGVWVVNPLLTGEEKYTLDIYVGELIAVPHKYISDPYNIIQNYNLGESSSLIQINIDGYKKVIAKIFLYGNGSNPGSTSNYKTKASFKAESTSLVDIYEADFTCHADSADSYRVAIIFFVYEEYENTDLAQIQIFTTTGDRIHYSDIELRKSAVVRTKNGSVPFTKYFEINGTLKFGEKSSISVYGIQ